MGKRKQVTGAKKEQKLKRKETPEDVYFAHLDDVKMREKGLGSILIQGIEWPEEEEDEGGECLPLTVEQLAILRYVIINAARKKKLIPGTNIITDGQGDQGGSIMWNTHTGNQAIFGALDEVAQQLMSFPFFSPSLLPHPPSFLPPLIIMWPAFSARLSP
jgi:hypothetical protein